LLLGHGNVLLNQHGAALATDSDARHVDAVLQAIIERRDQVAATGIWGKLANMQLAVRGVAADAVICLCCRIDDACARCAVASDVLRLY
jgi:hypothetical protein